MFDGIDQSRGGFRGAGAMTVAATSFGLFGSPFRLATKGELPAHLGATTWLNSDPPSRSSVAMQESSPNRQSHQKPVSIPERELLGFVSAVSELVGSEKSTFLREVWLDELASMETMPAPTSSEWRMVTVAAWARLAQRLVEIRIMTALDRTATAVQDKSFAAANTKV